MPTGNIITLDFEKNIQVKHTLGITIKIQYTMYYAFRRKRKKERFTPFISAVNHVKPILTL